MSFARSFPCFWLRTRAKSLAPRSFRGTNTPSTKSSDASETYPFVSKASFSSPSAVSGEETSRGASRTARAESLRPRGPSSECGRECFTIASASALAYPAARSSNAATTASARKVASSPPLRRLGSRGLGFAGGAGRGAGFRGVGVFFPAFFVSMAFAGNPVPRTWHTNGRNPNCATRTSSSSVAVAATLGVNASAIVAHPSAGTIPDAGVTEKRESVFCCFPSASFRHISSYSNAMGAVHVIVTVFSCVSPTALKPKSTTFGNATSFITGYACTGSTKPGAPSACTRTQS
mmetsp:Transcript_9428/g.39589  ORF Transcript_9428/g.39589 Transcript_9428/m.39589 type:complete len:291 (+) Transcript_9428:2147-3019(+)